MSRNLPYDPCQRRYLPTKLKAEIMLRQDGRCADCGTRLILGFFVFDHRPPLALRDKAENANDPDRLAAICWTCNEQKTPKDLKEIARTKRIAEKHQAYVTRQREKVPGRRLPTPRQARLLEASMRPHERRVIAAWNSLAKLPAPSEPSSARKPLSRRPAGLPPLLPKPKK